MSQSLIEVTLSKYAEDKRIEEPQDGTYSPRQKMAMGLGTAGALVAGMSAKDIMRKMKLNEKILEDNLKAGLDATHPIMVNNAGIQKRNKLFRDLNLANVGVNAGLAGGTAIYGQMTKKNKD